MLNKDIIIEDLNFKQTKAETEEAKSDKSKDYNKMIHLFDYLLINTSNPRKRNLLN